MLSSALLRANVSEEVLSQAVELELGKDRTWLKLLHFDADGKKSEVIDKSFFLSPKGSEDPVAELQATIEAYFDESSAGDESARCRFPARYYWLSHQLNLPGYSLRDSSCQRFEKWALLDTVDSVSLYLVSGYFGNPASTFGHSLLKLNTGFVEDDHALFDLAINYGALIPEGESTLTYVFKGIFGGYEAGFSDRYYYTQDIVYSNREFRDVWEYELNLSEYQKTLLVLHIWEIIGKKFQYFFLNKNCGYQLADLAELVVDEELLISRRGWYVPEETFHRLEVIDKERAEQEQPPLVKRVRHIPSARRKLFHEFSQLEKSERAIANQIIQDNAESIEPSLADLAEERQIRLLDTLFAYYQYLQLSEEPEPKEETVTAKNRLLLARLQRPPSSYQEVKVPELDSPAEGTAPGMLSVGYAHSKGGEDSALLQMAVYSKELVGRNSLEGSELVVGQLALGLNEEDDLFVDRLDFIRIKEFKKNAFGLEGENPWSWQLRLSTEHQFRDNVLRRDWFGRFGIGRAWTQSKRLTLYAMNDFGLHSLASNLRIRPHLGMSANFEDLKIWSYAGFESENKDGDFRNVWGGKAQYSFNSQYALQAEFSNERDSELTVAMLFFW